MPDDYKFDEGCILELNEYMGELVVVDENFAIKVTEVI